MATNPAFLTNGHRKWILFGQVLESENFERVICHGPWIIYGQYAIVQPCNINFSLLQPYPNVVIAWIRLPKLPGHMYKCKILREIRGMVGKVAKLDFNIDNGVRGKFAWMTVYVNLGKPLVSQILINGTKRRMAIGDFNAILSELDKKGGKSVGKRSHILATLWKPKTFMI